MFVGLRLPDQVATSLTVALGPVWSAGHDLVWTRPDGWHVTLAYLGATTLTIGEVTAAVVAGVVEARMPTLTIDPAATWFGRSLVLPVRDDPTRWCDRVGGHLHMALTAAGADVAQRTVRPHVTLARRRGRGRDAASFDEGGLAVHLRAAPTLSWRPTAVEIFRSVTGDGPASYPVQAAVPLPAFC